MGAGRTVMAPALSVCPGLAIRASSGSAPQHNRVAGSANQSDHGAMRKSQHLIGSTRIYTGDERGGALSAPPLFDSSPKATR